MIAPSESVKPTFRRPYTTTYIPIEKTTIDQGASLITLRVSIAGLIRVHTIKIKATTPAAIDTGTLINSADK
ncbi:hypothetical protein D3C76_1304550 [compost metagenome]